MRPAHEVLGISPSASPEEIKAAYRRLAQAHHPDRCPDDPAAPARFQEIQSAYQRMARPSGKVAGGAPDGWDNTGFADIFDVIFRRAAPRGPSYQGEITLSLEQALMGGSFPVEIASATDRLSVHLDVPAGIDDGQVMNGHAQGPSGPKPFSVRVRVRPHPVFHRDGLDLHVVIRVPYKTLVLGGNHAIELPYGKKVFVKVPRGTPSGQVLRLPSLGAPDVLMPGRRGALLCRVEVEVPAKIDASARRHLEAFDRCMRVQDSR